MSDERKSKSPAFQFYPKDFLSDEKQLTMSLAEAGAYIRLIAACWVDGSLPVEKRHLARLCGATSRQLTEMWPALGRCFHLTPDGSRYVHPRLEFERVKQETFRQRQTDKGIASAKMREVLAAKRKAELASTGPQPESNHGSISVNHPVQPESNSAVCDLRSADYVTKNKTQRESERDEEWAAFQAAYPSHRREGGFLAVQGFLAACEVLTFPVLLSRLDRQKRSEQWRKGMVPQLGNYFQRELWRQEPDDVAVVTGDRLTPFQLAKRAGLK